MKNTILLELNANLLEIALFFVQPDYIHTISSK